MANKKRKSKKKAKLATPIIVILILVLIAAVGTFLFFYISASKKLDKATYSISEVSVDKKEVSFEAMVSGEGITSFDIKASYTDGNSIYFTYDSKELNKTITYTKELDYGTYTIDLVVNASVFNIFDVTKEINIVKENTISYSPSDNMEGIVYDDFQIHFMMLGNDKAGDSIYIKAGDTDVLIDAGSRSNSFETTSAYINNYCTDSKIEYVIATHGDQDHIEAFPKFSAAYTFENIITNELTTKTTGAYKNMISAFDAQKMNGANWYYAADCYNNTNGAKRDFVLSDNVIMHVVYNYYYFNTSSDENDYSVCLLFEYKKDDMSKYFFLGGDLEEKGEEKMVEYYDSSTEEKTMPTVDLYKAGHHGSKTSSNTAFLNMLKPSMCVVSCCCGSNEYTTDYTSQFPTQQFINRIAVWTDKVYVTSYFDEKENTFKALNGNIIVSCGIDSEKGVMTALAASNNTIKLKDTEWFNEKIYVKDYEEATSDDNQNEKSVPHGNNSAKKGTNIFYNINDENVREVARRTWPEA